MHITALRTGINTHTKKTGKHDVCEEHGDITNILGSLKYLSNDVSQQWHLFSFWISLLRKRKKETNEGFYNIYKFDSYVPALGSTADARKDEE